VSTALFFGEPRRDNRLERLSTRSACETNRSSTLPSRDSVSFFDSCRFSSESREERQRKLYTAKRPFVSVPTAIRRKPAIVRSSATVIGLQRVNPVEILWITVNPRR